MAEYRFRLSTWSERDKALVCPNCGRGRGCYKVYVDQSGAEVDPDSHLCGKCDHENSCGYHVTPKEWLAKHPDKRADFVAEARPRKQKKRIEIPMDMVIDSACCYSRNRFCQWLEALPWNDRQRERIGKVLEHYFVGTTKDGRTIWWQIDKDMIVRTGKMMDYDKESGHRLKDEEGNSIGFNWAHTILRRSGKYMPEDEWELLQCLFGEHLISIYPEAEIHIVESEKTAVLMAIYDTQAFVKHLWLASGGLYNLSSAKIAALSGRKILVYPDTNGIEKWREKLEGQPVIIYTKWMKNVTEDDPKGADVADVMLRVMAESNRDPLEGMKKKNPLLQKLIDKLKLECTTVRNM